MQLEETGATILRANLRKVIQTSFVALDSTKTRDSLTGSTLTHSTFGAKCSLVLRDLFKSTFDQLQARSKRTTSSFFPLSFQTSDQSKHTSNNLLGTTSARYRALAVPLALLVNFNPPHRILSFPASSQPQEQLDCSPVKMSDSSSDRPANYISSLLRPLAKAGMGIPTFSHPLHPATVHMPIGLLSLSFVLDSVQVIPRLSQGLT